MNEEFGFILLVDWTSLLFGPIWRIGRICERLKKRSDLGNAEKTGIFRIAYRFAMRFHRAVTGD